MDTETLRRIVADVSEWGEGALRFFYQPSSLAQIGVVALCFVLASLSTG